MPSNYSLRWKPFNSLIESDCLVNELNEKRNEPEMPCLNNEQLMAIGEAIQETFEKEQIVKITYYSNKKTITITGQIQKISKTAKILYINNQNISFYKIIKIN